MLFLFMGKNIVVKRKDLWNFLKNLGYFIIDFWIVCGDFNVVLNSDDRIWGIYF